MHPTLVVVDMQCGFEASLDPNVVLGVTCEVLEARRMNAPIILLEYRDCGTSHQGLYRLLKNYKNKAVIGKDEDDGSREVIQAIKRCHFNLSHIRVCGVNADACVKDTVRGLLKKLPHTCIEVVKEACGTTNHKFSWRSFIKHKNVKLVNVRECAGV